MRLYSGKLKNCVHGSASKLGNVTIVKTICSDADSNFNHVFNAMVTLFSIGTLDNWIEDMNIIINQVKDVSFATSYFFMISFLLMMTFIMLNVFVGFVAVAFQMERDKKEGFCILDKHAQDCVRMALQMKMEPNKWNGTELQKRIRVWLDSHLFEYTVLFCVILNCVIMMTKHYNQPAIYNTIQENANLFFTSLFTIESLLKIFAMSPKGFIRDPWSVFDFLLVAGSWIDVTLQLFQIDIHINLTVFRLFRAIRVFRVLCKKGNLRQILATFISSIKSVPNIVCLVILVLFIYAVMGMQVSSKSKLSVFRAEAENQLRLCFYITRKLHNTSFCVVTKQIQLNIL